MLGIVPSQTPLPSKEFNKHIDALLDCGQLNPDIIPYFDSYQMYAINEVKKALIRLDNLHAGKTREDTAEFESTKSTV